jgi:hypothetical protein
MNWLRNLIARTCQPRPAPPPRRAFRPRLEALEDRCVPATLTVTNGSDDVALAHSLRWAVANAHNGDIIEIQPIHTRRWGDLAQHITLTHGELYLNQDVTIESIGPAAVIDGNFSSRVFEVVRTADVTLDNLVIMDGNARTNNSLGNAGFNGDGGGILNEGFLTIDHCLVSDNGETSLGGNNKAVKAGGGIYNYHGNLVVTESAVDDNFAGTGGGIYNDRGTLSIGKTQMAANHATGGGGAISNAVGTVWVGQNSSVAVHGVVPPIREVVE